MSPPAPLDARPTRRPDVISSEVLDELVVFSPATSQALSLNRTARAIWELCDGSRTVEAICVELARDAGTVPAAIHADVATAIAQLSDLGLLAVEAR